MAFSDKTKRGYCVKKGNTGETLSCFTGKDAKKMADKEVKRLHKKNSPKASSKGARAKKALKKKK